MLDRLPHELLDEVLAHLASPTSGDSVRERTAALLACCLTSMRMQSRAVFLLWRDIRLDGLTMLTMVLSCFEKDESGLKGKAVRSFRIEYDENEPNDNPPMADILVLFQLLPNLRNVHLETMNEVDLGALQLVLPNLRSLHLEFASLTDIDHSITFSHLQLLQLFYVAYSPCAPPSLFRSATFPSLRALVFTAPDLDYHPVSRLLADEFADELVKQLDVLPLHSEDDRIFSSALFRTTSPLLLTLTSVVYRPINVPVSHLRIAKLSTSDTLVTANVAQLRAKVESLALLSLHLPESLRQRASRRRNLAEELSALLRLCELRGVEVVWSQDSLETNHAFSPSFWRYAKCPKATQATSTTRTAIRA